ncbi:MAG TPA: hypothetical protein VE546_26285 [Streptomyces sp.]|uniref:hypothetical protein n=1 Tax=Streptomyces sp. TaxID=1931 RepID=UPI002D2AD38A|nr:hypothetical protein [Streptomyces sp.]HZG07034.1 hypothetical protein [Streptomyces sp.]
MSPVNSLLRTRKAASLAMVVAIAASVTAVTGATAASGSPRERPARASVTGAATFRLPYLEDADIRSLTFDAHAAPFSRPIPGVPGGLPTDAYGTVKVSHYSAAQDVTYTAEGAVDCLTTAPGSATLTAVITEVSAGGPDWVGKRLGFSVHDGGVDKHGKTSRDRVGFSWDDGVNWTIGADAHLDSVGSCMAPAPFAPVTEGGYRVRHADLPLWPMG